MSPLEIEPPDDRPMPLIAAGFEASLAVVAVVLGWVLGVDPLATLSGDLPAVAWGVLGAMPIFVMLAAMVWIPFAPFRQLLKTVDELLGKLFADARLFDLAIVSLMAGIGEEMLFRGIVQAAAQEWTGAPMLGLAISAVLFGLVHSVSVTYAIIATIVGSYLGWLWLATGNLLAPVVTHAVYDFGALWYLTRTRVARKEL